MPTKSNPIKVVGLIFFAFKRILETDIIITNNDTRKNKIIDIDKYIGSSPIIIERSIPLI